MTDWKAREVYRGRGPKDFCAPKCDCAQYGEVTCSNPDLEEPNLVIGRIAAALEEVAAAEREACAVAVADLRLVSPTSGPEYRQGYNLAREHAVEVVRDRGDK